MKIKFHAIPNFISSEGVADFNPSGYLNMLWSISWLPHPAYTGFASCTGHWLLAKWCNRGHHHHHPTSSNIIQHHLTSSNIIVVGLGNTRCLWVFLDNPVYYIDDELAHFGIPCGGRNPAPVGRWWFIPWFTGFQPSKVVQDFFHPRDWISPPEVRSEGRGLEAHLAALEPEIPGMTGAIRGNRRNIPWGFRRWWWFGDGLLLALSHEAR